MSTQPFSDLVAPRSTPSGPIPWPPLADLNLAVL